MIDLLSTHQRRIASLGDELDACLDGDGPLAIVRIGQLQWALARDVMRHAILIDHLAVRSQAEGGPKPRALARQSFAVVRTDQVLVRLQAHIHRWNAGAMIADRAGHAAATRDLLGAIRHRMALQERLLHPRFRKGGPVVVERRRRGRRPAGTAPSTPVC